VQLFAKDLLTLDNVPSGPPETWEIERLLVAAESLRASGRLRLQVRGESMLPSLWPGDVVEIANCSVDDVRRGEIVLALRDGRFFLHRFLGRSAGAGFFLRGDSMPAPDPEFSSEALLGRLVSPVHPLRSWSRPLGRLFCHFAPARRFSLRWHARGRGAPPLSPSGPRTSISILELPHAGS
jgi:hypothetical protein